MRIENFISIFHETPIESICEFSKRLVRRRLLKRLRNELEDHAQH